MRVSTIICLLPAALAAPASNITLGTALGNLLGQVLGPVLAPILKPSTAQLIANTYIVKLKDNTPLATLQKLLELLTNPASQTYSLGTFKGFSIKLTPADLQLLQSLNIVDIIEQDAVVSSTKYTIQNNAPWGIARVSHKDPGGTTYVSDDSAGAGTCAYVVDTGIYTAHSDFGGRATWLANFVDKINSDGAGHGTHVAGTIGGATYGIAKKTKLYAVKVLDSTGTGSISGIIAGINFVAGDLKNRSCPNGTVANLSLGGSTSPSLNAAAKALVNAGVFMAVSAGNDNHDASLNSPASEPTVCTVGSTTSTDEKSDFSNYGSLVDIFAPGSYILSAGTANPYAYATMSGTSMASPHVAGLAAYLLTFRGKRTPAALCSYIKNIANGNEITGLSTGTVNQIAFNGNPSG